jgi:hypothetical protein
MRQLRPHCARLPPRAHTGGFTMPRTRTAQQYRRLAADCGRSADAAQTSDRQLCLRLAGIEKQWLRFVSPIELLTVYQRARPAKQAPQHDRPSVLPGSGLFARSAVNVSSSGGRSIQRQGRDLHRREFRHRYHHAALVPEVHRLHLPPIRRAWDVRRSRSDLHVPTPKRFLSA